MKTNKRILTVVGARPQFVKAAVVSRELKKHPHFTESILHTGQHYDESMSEVFFREMEIPVPAWNLKVKAGTHGIMTGEMLAGIEQVVLKEKPDIMLVYGDTNSTLAGALAASKLHVKLVHVEAGLRSFNMNMPEEVNRILTDRVSDLLCCPSENAMENLRNEGFDKFNCVFTNTGDVMQDAVLYYSTVSESRSEIMKRVGNADFVLCTLHRAENTNDPQRLAGIISALNKINSVSRIILPVHPRTKKVIQALGLKTEFEVYEPLGYFDMLELLKNCSLVMTDSGGLQKEAYFFSKPCVTLRDETEWPELIENGCNVLAGAMAQNIVEAFEKMRHLNSEFRSNIYGDGHAAAEIINALEQHM